jgi:hypothetical protein
MEGLSYDASDCCLRSLFSSGFVLDHCLYQRLPFGPTQGRFLRRWHKVGQHGQIGLQPPWRSGLLALQGKEEVGSAARALHKDSVRLRRVR